MKQFKTSRGRTANRSFHDAIEGSLLAAKRKTALVAHFTLALVVIMILTSPPLVGQTSTGSISGNVLDSQGNAIAGATVRAIKLDTGEVQTRQSSSAGSYRIDALRPGQYSVKVVSQGFKGATVNNVSVIISTTTAQDVRLDVGGATEAVTITTAGAALQTESSDIGTSVGPKLVQDLPLSVGSGEMRSVIDFIFLEPVMNFG